MVSQVKLLVPEKEGGEIRPIKAFSGELIPDKFLFRYYHPRTYRKNKKIKELSQFKLIAALDTMTKPVKSRILFNKQVSCAQIFLGAQESNPALVTILDQHLVDYRIYPLGFGYEEICDNLNTTLSNLKNRGYQFKKEDSYKLVEIKDLREAVNRVTKEKRVAEPLKVNLISPIISC